MLAALFLALHQSLAQHETARDERMEFCGEVIGRLNGRDIYAAVRYRGRRYHFERVVPDIDRHVLRRGEILVEPGLLYVCEPPPGVPSGRESAR